MSSTLMPDVLGTVSIPLYDTYIAAKNTELPASILMFTDPIGPNKGRNRTNLQTSKRIQSPGRFELRAIRCVFGPRVERVDAATFAENYILRLMVGDNDAYAQGGIEFFPAGGGFVDNTAIDGAAAATTLSYFTNGLQDPRAINVMESGLVIDAGEDFWVEMEGSKFTLSNPTTGGGLWFRVYLDGVLSRGVRG